MRETIPAPVMAVVAEAVAAAETHATLDTLFMYAGAPGDPPEGSKHAKALEWLRRVNQDPSVQPLRVLGRLIEGYMDAVPQTTPAMDSIRQARRDRIAEALALSQLQYARGGIVSGALAAPSRTLEQLIRERDLASVSEEFERALRNVEANPREAVSAACNIIEAVCKVYIHDEALQPPGKQDLQGLWTPVRKDLGFDPSAIEDRDLQEILSGLVATVNGIGALRTHASTAHGGGRKRYALQPRHARLAVHAAHTLTLFILETWDQRRGST
jgi:hypothetical protein